jgi:hypothetical protein
MKFSRVVTVFSRLEMVCHDARSEQDRFEQSAGEEKFQRRKITVDLLVILTKVQEEALLPYPLYTLKTQ